MNVAGARLAREAAGEPASSPARSGRSTSRSRSPARRRAGLRTHTFDQVRRGLRRADPRRCRRRRRPPAVETIFDTLNCKAAIVAAHEVAPQLPLWICVTIVDLSGRTLTGQTIEAFWVSIEHAEPLIVGVNCSLGAKQMRPYVAGPGARRDVPHLLPPERRPPERVRRLRRGARRDEPSSCASSPQDGLPERRRRLLRHDARAHEGDRGHGARVWPREHVHERTPAQRGAAGWSRSRSGRTRASS